ncbi:hypothetical protein AB1N83_003644 [Pleurotus pulmonarius]
MPPRMPSRSSDSASTAWRGTPECSESRRTTGRAASLDGISMILDFDGAAKPTILQGWNVCLRGQVAVLRPFSLSAHSFHHHLTVIVGDRANVYGLRSTEGDQIPDAWIDRMSTTTMARYTGKLTRDANIGVVRCFSDLVRVRGSPYFQRHCAVVEQPRLLRRRCLVVAHRS